MLKHFFSILLTFTVWNAQCQDYSNYYNRCNTADSLEYIGLSQQALTLSKLLLNQWIMFIRISIMMLII